MKKIKEICTKHFICMGAYCHGCKYYKIVKEEGNATKDHNSDN